MNRSANYSYLRLPEIYLTYAEALNELGRRDESYEWLNKVRTRVGLPEMNDALLSVAQNGKTLPTYTEPLTGNAQLREEILDERARELSLRKTVGTTSCDGRERTYFRRLFTG